MSGSGRNTYQGFVMNAQRASNVGSFGGGNRRKIYLSVIKNYGLLALLSSTVVYYFNWLPFLSDMEAYFSAKLIASVSIPRPIVFTQYAGWLLLLFSFCYLCITRPRFSIFRDVAATNIPLFVFLSIALVGCIYTSDILVSLRTFGVYLFWIFPPILLLMYSESDDNFLEYLNLSFIITLFICLVGIVVIPERAIHSHSVAISIADDLAGGWKGAFAHKNFAGGIISLLLMINILMFKSDKEKIFKSIVIVLSLVFLWFSKSKTAMISVPVVLALGWLLISLNINNIFRLTSAVVSSLFYVAFPFISLYFIYPLTGIDFTSRIFIWKAHIEFAARHPIFGAGFTNVFNDVDGINTINHSLYVMNFPHAHNGPLQVYDQLGVIGLIALASFVAYAIFSYLNEIERRHRSLPLQILLCCFLLTLVRSEFEPDLLFNRPHSGLLIVLGMVPSYFGLKRNRRLLLRAGGSRLRGKLPDEQGPATDLNHLAHDLSFKKS